MAEARTARAERAPHLNPRHLVFLDGSRHRLERGDDEHGPALRRAPRGERALDAVPHGHRRTAIFVGALRADGLVAPLVLDGAINGRAVLACVRRFPAPALRSGDVLVMDNLSSHKVAGVCEAVETAGATLL